MKKSQIMLALKNIQKIENVHKKIKKRSGSNKEKLEFQPILILSKTLDSLTNRKIMLNF